MITTKSINMETYKAWRVDNLEIRNYGGNGFNVYLDGGEIDYFTYYGNSTEEVIKEYIKKFEFNNI
jgi:alpha-glucosidase (family GH31 glycosyl hydrolase)